MPVLRRCTVRRINACGLSLAFALGPCAIEALAQTSKLESYTCEHEKEAFESFKAGIPFDPEFVPPSDVTSLAYATQDGRRLYGYMAKARTKNGSEVAPKGYILVLPGNAMYAQQLVPTIRDIALYGYDVYVYDYRGYGRSQEGTSTVRALIEDSKALVASLNLATTSSGNVYATRNVYAISAGAAIAVIGFDKNMLIDKIVLDGTPARISFNVPWFMRLFVKPMTCPSGLDPVNRPISFGKAGLMIVGGHDRVLRNTQNSARQEQLVAHARTEGLCVVQQPKFGHPFLNDEYAARRLGMVISFIAAEKSGGCPEFHVDQ